MDNEMKKALLRKIPYGLYVIGTKQDTTVNGFTGSWLSQISFEPPMIIIGVQKKSAAYKMVEASKVFTVNFLSKSQTEIAKTFFRPSKIEGNTMGGYAYHTDITGAPILDDAVGYLECKVNEIAGSGDHAVVIGDILNANFKKESDILILSDTPWNYGG